MARPMIGEPMIVGTANSTTVINGSSIGAPARAATWKPNPVERAINEPPIAWMCTLSHRGPNRRRPDGEAANQPTHTAAIVGGTTIWNGDNDGQCWSPMTKPTTSTGGIVHA